MFFVSKSWEVVLKRKVAFLILFIILAFLMLASLSFAQTKPAAKKPVKEKIVKGQKTPDVKRATEIQKALIEHGYPVEVTGKIDDNTREVLRGIADKHKWQVKFVPDARVLILLGLGGQHANEDVLIMTGNRLDMLMRHERPSDEPDEEQ